IVCSFFCFFFQAEDGIRDFHVTGVQTCALPILFLRRNRYVEIVGRFRGLPDSKRRRFTIVAWAYLTASLGLPGVVLLLMMRLTRSEERRVGKECRSGWTPEE